MATILDNVLAAMQEADEMGGPEPEEYIDLMKKISSIALDRAANAQALIDHVNDPMNDEIDTVPGYFSEVNK